MTWVRRFLGTACVSALLFAASDLPLFAAQRLITGAAVRVRAEPTTKSAEVLKLHFGDVLEQLEKSSKPETIGKKQDHWYKLKLPSGSSGWVFGGFTIDFDDSRREALYRRLVEERLAQDSQNALDWLELFEFLDRVNPTITSTDDKPFFELGHLRALQKYLDFCQVKNVEELEAVPSVRGLLSQLIWNEPAAACLVNRDLFWDLYQRYRDHAFADELAWAAASQDLPGETEGYPPAVVVNAWEKLGRYLEAKPQGKYAEEAVARLGEWLTFSDADLKQVEGDEIKRMKGDLEKLKKVVQFTLAKSRDAVMNKLTDLLMSL